MPCEALRRQPPGDAEGRVARWGLEPLFRSDQTTAGRPGERACIRAEEDSFGRRLRPGCIGIARLAA